MHGLLQSKDKKFAQSLSVTCRYIDDVLSLNIIGDHIDLIYPIELEIKDTTETERPDS